MNKEVLLEIVNQYLSIFPKEKRRQRELIRFLKKYDHIDLIDWNNFYGHIVASGFIYAKEESKFLMVFHKDLKCYLYPGGHINRDDKNTLEAAIREIQEETALKSLKEVKVCPNDLVPFDIDIHKINYNKRLNLQSHYHYDFRYLFTIDKIENVHIDTDELKDYKWINRDELEQNKRFAKVTEKIKEIEYKNSGG